MSVSRVRTLVWMVLALTATVPVAAQQTVALPGRDNALGERPTDVYAVGAVDGADWEMFSGIRSVAFDASDNLYLLDGQNTRVVVFDARGRFARQFGRKGGGPGELQAPLAMDIAADGSVVVSDIGNRAFVVFRPDGEYVRNIPFGDEFGFPMAMAADRSGGIITRSMQRVRPDQAPGDAGFAPIHRQPLDGADPRLLTRVPVTPPRVVENSVGSGGRRVSAIRMDPVFGPSPSFGVLPAGLALHHDTEYAIRIHDNDGRHIRTLTRDFAPRRVTKKDQEEWREQRSRELAEGGGPTVVVARATPAGASTTIGQGGASAMPFNTADTPFAEFMSVVTAIRTDPLGRIWVQRRNRNGRPEGPIDLVMADGRYIGTLSPQPMPKAVSATGLAAWVVTDDELGVERVIVRRLPSSWR